MSNALLNQIKLDPRYSPYNSALWFQNKVKELLGKDRVSSIDMLKNTPNSKLRTAILPGRMYAFVYDPKFKKQLPYYDKFPLILPFNRDHRSFIGLNLHYLPYNYRLILLDKLMQFSIHNKRGELAYLRFSWSLIGSVSKFKEVKPCVKRYLNGYVKSRFIQIPSEDWATACMMPMENFAKGSLTSVWSDSVGSARIAGKQ